MLNSRNRLRPGRLATGIALAALTLLPHPLHAALPFCLRAGWALRGTGDWETLPRLDEVRDLLGP